MASFDLSCSEGLDDALDAGTALSGLPVADHASGLRCKRKLSDTDTYLAAGSGWDLLVCNSGDHDEGRSDSARSGQATPPGDSFGLLIPSKRRLEAREALDASCFSRGSAPSSTVMSAAQTPKCISRHSKRALALSSTNSCSELLAGMLEDELPPKCKTTTDIRLLIDFVCHLCTANDLDNIATGLAIHLAATTGEQLVGGPQPQWRHETVGAACVWVASKYHENADNFLTSDQLYNELKRCDAVGDCEAKADWQQHLCCVEAQVLQLAGWTLEVPTVHSFAQILIQDFHMADLEGDLREVLRQVSKLRYSSALGQQPLSVLAAGALLALLDHLGQPGMCLSQFLGALDNGAVQRTQAQISAELWK